MQIMQHTRIFHSFVTYFLGITFFLSQVAKICVYILSSVLITVMPVKIAFQFQHCCEFSVQNPWKIFKGWYDALGCEFDKFLFYFWNLIHILVILFPIHFFLGDVWIGIDLWRVTSIPKLTGVDVHGIAEPEKVTPQAQIEHWSLSMRTHIILCVRF